MLKLNRRNDYKFLEYYNICDFVNKYNLMSSENKPYLKNIVLEISLDDIIKSFNSKFESFNENTIQVISVVFFYFVTNRLGYIKLNNFKESDSLSNNNKLCSLKVVLNKTSQIYNFLHNIYLKLNKDIRLNSSYYKKKELILAQKCNIEIFFGLESFIKKYIKNINTKELNLNLYLKFSNLKNNFISNILFLNK